MSEQLTRDEVDAVVVGGHEMVEHIADGGKMEVIAEVAHVNAMWQCKVCWKTIWLVSSRSVGFMVPPPAGRKCRICGLFEEDERMAPLCFAADHVWAIPGF